MVSKQQSLIPLAENIFWRSVPFLTPYKCIAGEARQTPLHLASSCFAMVIIVANIYKLPFFIKDWGYWSTDVVVKYNHPRCNHKGWPQIQTRDRFCKLVGLKILSSKWVGTLQYRISHPLPQQSRTCTEALPNSPSAIMLAFWSYGVQSD